MAKQYDWTPYEEWEKKNGISYREFAPTERDFEASPQLQEEWKIPDKICIQATLSGGGPHITSSQNPNQPMDLDEIRDSAEDCIKNAHPTLVHFDNYGHTWHNKKGEQFEPGDTYTYCILPLLEKYGRENLVTHCNILRGSFYQQMLPVVNGITEISYLTGMNYRWAKATVDIMKENNVRGELVVHNSAEIDLINRFFLKTGLCPNPNLWIILNGVWPTNPNTRSEYIPNERAMMTRLIQQVVDIRDLDPEAFIIVCQNGRATRYMITCAMLLGIHVRTGMEDTIYKYPHKKDLITRNAEEVIEAAQIANLLGRKMMTPNEYREAVGLKPRFDFAPKGVTMPTPKAVKK